MSDEQRVVTVLAPLLEPSTARETVSDDDGKNRFARAGAGTARIMTDQAMRRVVTGFIGTPPGGQALAGIATDRYGRSRRGAPVPDGVEARRLPRGRRPELDPDLAETADGQPGESVGRHRAGPAMPVSRAVGVVSWGCAVDLVLKVERVPWRARFGGDETSGPGDQPSRAAPTSAALHACSRSPRDRANRRPLRRVLTGVLLNKPDGALTHLRGIRTGVPWVHPLNE